MNAPLSSQILDHPKSIRFFLGTVLLAVTLALGLLGYIGTFSRYMGDDYCSSSMLQSLGYMPSQWYWYTQWTGRFSFTWLITSIELMGSAIVPFLPAVMIILFCLASIWAAYQLVCLAHWSPAYLHALGMGLGFVFALLATTPNIVQSLYWQTGAITYLLPLILFTSNVGTLVWIYRRDMGFHIPALFIIMLLSFFAAGLSDMFALFQIVILLAATLLIWKKAALHQRLMSTIVPTLLVSCLATMIIALAPGNTVRQSVLSPHTNLITASMNSVYYAARTVFLTFVRAPLHSLFAFVLPAMISLHVYRTKKPLSLPHTTHIRAAIRISILSALLILTCTFPVVYMLSSSVPLRARIIPQYVTISALFAYGILAGRWMTNISTLGLSIPRSKQGIVVSCLLILLISSPLASAYTSLKLIPQARAGAAQWDAIDQQLRRQQHTGQVDISIPALDLERHLGASATELSIEADPNSWKNICVARYYRLRSIRSVP